MKLEYQGQEQIPVGADAVWAFVTDPDKVAHCLPDLIEATVTDPTHFEAVVRVGVGPVRGRLKFKFTLKPDDAARHIGITASGGGFGSVIDLDAGADVKAGGETATTLDWKGEAEMRGPIAAVGGRVLDGQARKLIEQTFSTVRERLSAR
ncbi:MAG: carbon monoxide dehydrogenase subunit G [Vicinamibacterales bacterium]